MHSSVSTRRRLLGAAGVATLAAVAGCTSFGGPETATGQGARVVIVLSNADETERAYEVEVDWGEHNRSVFAGTLQPAETDSEMIATTGTAPESARFRVDAAGGARSGTWRPVACPEYRVDATIENGTPSFATTCQGSTQRLAFGS
jgi:hypothetical protein